MPSAPVLDLPALLAPIPGDNPAGAYFRPSSPEFVKMTEFLPKADKAVAISIEEKSKGGDWPGLLKYTSNFLITKSKDLRFAERLLQASIYEHGFVGLRDSLHLLTGLLTDYWDTVYPLPEDGDMDIRLQPLVHLFGEAEAPVWVRDQTIADSEAVNSENDNVRLPATLNLYTLTHEVKATELDSEARGYEELKRKHPPYFTASLKNVIAKTKPAFYIKRAEDVLEAIEACKKFNDCANERFGKMAPYTGTVREALEAFYSRIATICKERNISLQGALAVPVAAQPTAAGDDNVQSSAQVAASNGHSGPISTRGEALAKLREIAEFLKRAEPHSPVSYLINRAISWSEMPFEKLLSELVTDPNSRDAINATLGIKTDDGSGTWGSSGSGDSEPP
jgi:type VI secretion system protein ImpA